MTIVAVGALLYPALVKVGFSDKFSLGLVTSSGSLGLLLAPSLPLILYGIVAQQTGLGEPFSIQDLFIAGLLPAGLMVLLLSLWAVWQQRDQWHQRQRFYGGGTRRCPCGRRAGSYPCPLSSLAAFTPGVGGV